ncbi:MAG: M14 family zinc carboxypeptidase [Gemmatimonadota bacterium]
MIRHPSRAPVLAAAVASLLCTPAGVASQEIPTPSEFFGFTLGSDRRLADWRELTAYYEVLAERSPRVRVDTLGQTTRGRPFVMVTVTSGANQVSLDDLHAIQMKLSDPRTVSGPDELNRLFDEGRAVVLVTHGIHATEVGGSQMAARLLWRLATSDEPRVRRILDEVILLDIPSLNPDGLQWVVDWYERWVGTEFEGAPLPWLYQFYVGHDNNRDWYAFTQDETINTIRGAHNAWHPQIVHDIHQMGGTGARIFFPPYIDPWEPNIDPALTAAVNQLGSYMAAELLGQGKKGVVINAQYDAFTPARAYQHYHGGARILSETASARMATPVDVPPDRLQGPRRGYRADTRSWNFPAPWEGGHWALSDIMDYMEAGAMALLSNAAKNRRYWLENFYGINRRAVDGWARWPEAWVIPADQDNPTGLAYVLRVLTMGDVEVHRAEAAFQADGIRFPAGSYVVPMHQPYASFAQTMLEVQHYPDLREYPGGPPRRPYDVTAHTLPLLMDVEAVALDEVPGVELSEPIPEVDFDFRLPASLAGGDAPRVAIYKSWRESMDEGWTRWLFDEYGVKYDTLHDADIRRGELENRFDVILLQNQSPASILGGFPPGTVPPGYAGGLGEEGAEALKRFVEGGGRLVAVEGAARFAMDLLGVGVTNAVEGLANTDFYIPGSILRLEVERELAQTAGTAEESIAWYGRASLAFQVEDPEVEVLARYGSGDPLLSGWVLGGEHVAGKPALVRAGVGSGSVVLFAFQPNYRAQTVATWPLLFDALAR